MSEEMQISSVEEAISSRLQTIAGMSGKVYPVEAMKNAAAPFLFYEFQGLEAEETLAGDCDLLSCEAVIHAVGESYGSMRTLFERAANTIRAMTGADIGRIHVERAHVRQTSPDIRENEVNLYRRALAAEINYYIKED